MLDDPRISEPNPPGAYSEFVPHPSGVIDNNEIEIAIFKEHRFSFFFWAKWANRIGINDEKAPTLVTIDWHRDLAPPSDSEKKMLSELRLQDLVQVNEFSFRQLNPHNDSHILSAAWLGLLGDIILLKNHGMEQITSWNDYKGNSHKIFEFRDLEYFISEITKQNKVPVYLDIDLDYFIKNKIAPQQHADVKLYKDDKIKAIIDPRKDLFLALKKNLKGITIATEPRYCGGVMNSIHILDVLLNQWFTPEMEWHHL